MILLMHMTPAWSPSKQLLTPPPVNGQSRTFNSVPVHATWSIHTGPTDGPTYAIGTGASPHPNSRHKTVASSRPQPVLHTDPQ